MHLEIDTLAYRNRLSSLPPEQKLIFAVVLLAIAAIGHPPTQIAIAIWMALWILAYARIPPRVYWKLMAVMSIFLLMSLPALAVQIVFSAQIEIIASDAWKGANFGQWYVYISRSGIGQAALIAIRSLASISCLLFLLLTVPFVQLLQTFRRLGMPALLGELLLLMYRFVFILLQTASQLKTAQQARGGYRSWTRSMHSISLLVSQLLARSLQRYQQFSLGVAARGFEGEFRVESLGRSCYSKRYALEAAIGCIVLGGLEVWMRVS